jgi:predicted nucleic acid-binding Zn ribbon protein
MQRMNDPLPGCPQCGVDEVKKRVSVTSFVLKGGGWYSDHYGLKKTSAPSEGGSSGGASTPATPSAAPAATSSAPAAPAGGGSGSSGSSGST